MARQKHGHRSRQRTHAKHRSHSRSRLTVAFHHGPPPGPGVVQASMDEVLGALQAHGDLDWSEAADLVVPVMPRVRPFPPGTPPPLQALVDPGIVVGFGVDVGPAFMAVTPELAAHWKVTT